MRSSVLKQQNRRILDAFGQIKYLFGHSKNICLDAPKIFAWTLQKYLFGRSKNICLDAPKIFVWTLQRYLFGRSKNNQSVLKIEITVDN